MEKIADKLKRIESTGEVEPDLSAELRLIGLVIEGMKKGG